MPVKFREIPSRIRSFFHGTLRHSITEPEYRFHGTQCLLHIIQSKVVFLGTRVTSILRVGTQYISYRDRYYFISLAYLSAAGERGPQVVIDADSSTSTPAVDCDAAADLAASTSTPLNHLGARLAALLSGPLRFVSVSATQGETHFAARRESTPVKRASLFVDPETVFEGASDGVRRR